MPVVDCGSSVCLSCDRMLASSFEVSRLLSSRAICMKTAIRENVRLAECPSMAEPITAYAPGSAGAEDYRALADEIIAQEFVSGTCGKVWL